jgi:uncharacterized protein
MADRYHSGEREIQDRAGTRDQAEAVAGIVESGISAAADRFLRGQTLAVASSVEGGGRVWASLLAGPPGFIGAVDAQLLRIAARPAPGDPLEANLAARPELGLLVLDPATRRRMRLNGRGQVAPEGIFVLVDQTYGNCPKYIRTRRLEPTGLRPGPAPARAGDRLDPRQQDWVRGADTLFIATVHPTAGADASHRGGAPGFVRVLGPQALEFDDYQGNGMFNTLGNLVANPRAGLLFVDFEQGHLLQVTGRAQVGADFSVRLDVESVRETAHGSSQRWTAQPPATTPASSHSACAGISSTAAAESRIRRSR